jgi:hypothetical protein
MGRMGCICQHDTVLDHAGRWIDRDGYPVITREAYQVHSHELVAFLQEVDRLGLRVYATGRSSWYPGHTLALVIMRKSDPDLPE